MSHLITRPLRRALFLREEPGLAPPEVVEHAGTSVYFLLARPDGASASTFRRRFLSEIANRVDQFRHALGAREANLYHNVSARGLEVLPMTLTRTHLATRLISGLHAQQSPPAFDLHLIPKFDALIEFHFDTALDDGSRAALAEFASTLATVTGTVESFECDRRYTVVESTSHSNTKVFLSVVTRTPWNRSLADAQDYWINEHAPLVVDNFGHLNATGYEQVHTTQQRESTFDNGYAGIAFIEFPALGAYLAQLARLDTKRFNNTLVLDELNLTVNSHINLLRRHTLS
ncbi:MAG: hypothetical protein H5T82_06720 [Demequina sp.]|nr:hypothetical protein [Demequina sp.]